MIPVAVSQFTYSTVFASHCSLPDGGQMATIIWITFVSVCSALRIPGGTSPGFTILLSDSLGLCLCFPFLLLYLFILLDF